MIRIIAGSLKNRAIAVPHHGLVRPTANMVRKAVFDILGARIEFTGMRFLDLCAGTGAVGLEAISRGASFVEFIESDAQALKLIQENLRVFRVEDRALAHTGLMPRNKHFDAAFVDPPYAEGELGLDAAIASLNPGAYLFHETDMPEPAPVAGAAIEKIYKYGKTFLHLYSRKA
ncbi:MAG: RsmD family RNA methyltransferase [Candidatus Hydrogenedentota bacterium]